MIDTAAFLLTWGGDPFYNGTGSDALCRTWVHRRGLQSSRHPARRTIVLCTEGLRARMGRATPPLGDVTHSTPRASSIGLT